MSSRSVAVLSDAGAPAVELHGYGQVGRALAERLNEVRWPLAEIRNRRGLIASHPVHGAPRVVVDATTPFYAEPEGDRWAEHLAEVLRSGTSVVTCNKAPLATNWLRLEDAARSSGANVWCSATVGAGTPVLSTLRRLHEGHGVQRVEASLSGTLAFVLARVAEGQSFDGAIQAAQQVGYAEPDPTLDLDGTDAFAKALIIHNLLFPGGRPLTLRERGPPLRLTEDGVRSIVAEGRWPRVVARIESGRVGLQLEGTAPTTDNTPNLVSVRAVCHDGSAYDLTGPGAGPRATAGALLGDLRAILRSSPQAAGGIRP